MPENKLAHALEGISGQAIDWIAKVLSLPIDTECAPLLRAQSAAAMTALNTQLRADALRLRAAREDKALEALLFRIAEQERRIPHKASLDGSPALPRP